MKAIHYKGAQPAYLDVIAGSRPVFLDNMSTAMACQGRQGARSRDHVEEASSLMPELPTVDEPGVPGYEYHLGLDSGRRRARHRR